jgi:predicted RNase H-like HicB family nuclease
VISAPQKVQVSFTLPITIEKKGEWFIATCSVFDVVTQGETWESAKTNCEDALVFFLQSCIKRGTIFQVLQDSGFVEDRDAPPDEPADENSVQVHIPLPFVIAAQNSSPSTS